jgi:hypothetical protein
MKKHPAFKNRIFLRIRSFGNRPWKNPFTLRNGMTTRFSQWRPKRCRIGITLVYAAHDESARTLIRRHRHLCLHITAKNESGTHASSWKSVAGSQAVRCSMSRASVLA